MSTENFWLALMLTMFAGLSTGIGGLIALFTKRENTRFLSSSLGFSAGVMIYVSFVEILPKARQSLVTHMGANGEWITLLSFFGGMALIGLIDHFIPDNQNPHEIVNPDEIEQTNHKKLYRMGTLTALAIAIHNFPEGLATFIAALQDPTIAIPIVIAIALHNIPEGVAVAVPIFHATGSKKKAFVYSLLSGLSEPLGAIVGWVVLSPFMNEATYGIIFGLVAGIMVFISIDELLPAAEEFGEHHLSIYGMVGGMALMAMSLLLF